MAIRWALMGHQFSEDLMWNSEILDRASIEIVDLRLQLSRVDVAPTDPVITAIIAALSDNLDTHKVQEILRSWMRDTSEGKTGGQAGELSRALDTLLGLAL
jgi:L-cysteine:1D-myo-inositol 2-amino-2-deoxy-alpha-D-glucopyranoside ligase